MNRLRTLFALNADKISDEDRRFAVQARLYGMGYRYNPTKTDQYLEEHGRANPLNHVMVYTRGNLVQGRQDFAIVSTRKHPEGFFRISANSNIAFFDQPAGLPFSNFYPDPSAIENWREIKVSQFLSKTENALIKNHIKTKIRNLVYPNF